MESNTLGGMCCACIWCVDTLSLTHTLNACNRIRCQYMKHTSGNVFEMPSNMLVFFSTEFQRRQTQSIFCCWWCLVSQSTTQFKMI